MPDQFPKRGAIPTPRSVLAAAVPYSVRVGAPPNSIVIPRQISMWGNDVHGNCVTAEEAFAKACNNPEIFISDDEVIAWATKHGVLEGANLAEVLTWMQNDGFVDSPFTYDDGPHFSVDWTNAATLQIHVQTRPDTVACDQIETAYHAANGQTGWFATGFQQDNNETTAPHCAATGPYPGWRNSLASRSPRESPERSQAMRCSRGIPSGSSTCPPWRPLRTRHGSGNPLQ